MSTPLHSILARIQADVKAPKGQYNSFGKYSYRSCEDIMAAVKPLLGSHGVAITVSDEMLEVGGRIYCRARATIHGEGESISTDAYAREEESKKGMDAAQLSGACSSYARKYALSGLLCLDSADDPDATNKHGKEEKSQPKAEILKPSAGRIAKQPSAKQVALVKDLWARHGINKSIDGLSAMEVSNEISRLVNEPVGEAKKQPQSVTQSELPTIATQDDDEVPF